MNTPTPLSSNPAPGELGIWFSIPIRTARAFRAAIVDFSNQIGTHLEAPHEYKREQDLTHIAAAMGRLRSAVCAAVPA